MIKKGWLVGVGSPETRYEDLWRDEGGGMKVYEGEG